MGSNVIDHRFRLEISLNLSLKRELKASKNRLPIITLEEVSQEGSREKKITD